MARRGAKKAIANKLGKTEQGKYSAKYALSELLIVAAKDLFYDLRFLGNYFGEIILALFISEQLFVLYRHIAAFENYIRELKMLGIAVISEKENINTLTAESEMYIFRSRECFSRPQFATRFACASF